MHEAASLGVEGAVCAEAAFAVRKAPATAMRPAVMRTAFDIDMINVLLVAIPPVVH
jgi:hypothetical protein